MGATKNGQAYNYTGYACYIATFGMWVPCAADYKKGGAIGKFRDGELISLLRYNREIDNELMLKLKF